MLENGGGMHILKKKCMKFQEIGGVERDRKRERERQTQRERERESDRQRATDRERQTERERERATMIEVLLQCFQYRIKKI